MSSEKRCSWRRLVWLLAAACLPAAACGVPTAPAFPTDAPPASFHVNWSAWGWGSHDVLLRGDTLVIVRAQDYGPRQTVTSRVTPTRARWQAFWRAADGAGVRAWPRQCSDDQVMDGGGFSLEITYEHGRVQASGANAYPDRSGHCVKGGQTTPEVQAFLEAVATLIGTKFP